MWTDANERVLRAPFDYLDGNPGKDLRAALVSVLAGVLRVPEAPLEAINRIVHTLHTASLLVDDVEDAAVLRRGAPAAHTVFGTARTINSGNYMVFVALGDAFENLGAPAAEIVNEEVLALHRGQGLDIFWRDAHVCPTEAEYEDMVGNKTGGLLRLAVRLMGTAAPAESRGLGEPLAKLATTLGVLYQIQDDYLGLASDDYAAAKGFAEDITEGKFSYPVMHSVRASPGPRPPLLDILDQRTADPKLKRQALEYIAATGSLEHSRSAIRRHARGARAQVSAMGLDAASERLLLGLVDKLVLIGPEDADDASTALVGDAHKVSQGPGAASAAR